MSLVVDTISLDGEREDCGHLLGVACGSGVMETRAGMVASRLGGGRSYALVFEGTQLGRPDFAACEIR